MPWTQIFGRAALSLVRRVETSHVDELKTTIDHSTMQVSLLLAEQKHVFVKLTQSQSSDFSQNQPITH